MNEDNDYQDSSSAPEPTRPKAAKKKTAAPKATAPKPAKAKKSAKKPARKASKKRAAPTGVKVALRALKAKKREAELQAKQLDNAINRLKKLA